MNILQIISGPNVNGAVTYCKFLSEKLLERGHQVSFICRPNGWLQDHLDPAIEIFESEQNRSLPELLRVSRWIRSRQFDLMHTHMSRAHSLGILMKLMTGTPVVATAHQCSFQLHWRFNDFVIANSKYTEQYQRRVNRVPSKRIKSIYCFTNLERFRNTEPIDIFRVKRQLRLQGDEFLVGVVGDVIARKGHQFLFEALPQIVNAIPDFKLVLVGRFNRNERFVKKLRQLQKDNELFRRVYWLGLRDNIQDFMAAFDLCVVPSVEEPLGLVALEAMAAGTPVVASRTGGLTEIVDHRINGLLVEKGDPKALAQAIIDLARQPRLRVELGANGREMVMSDFNPDDLVTQVESVYQSLLSRRSTRAA